MELFFNKWEKKLFKWKMSFVFKMVHYAYVSEIISSVPPMRYALVAVVDLACVAH